MGRLLTLFPSVRLKVYVDDICATVTGQASYLREVVPDIVATTINLMGDVGLGVSREQKWMPGGKSVVLSASRWLRAELATTMRYHGVLVKKATVYMGVDAVVAKSGPDPRLMRACIS